MILAGDVGGTKCNLALFAEKNGTLTPVFRNMNSSYEDAARVFGASTFWTTLRIFLPLMQLPLPEIVDVNLPPEGVFHNLMIVAIKKSYAGHARKIMNGIWAMGKAMFTKCIIVVDEDCDVHDLAEVPRTLRRWRS